MGWENKPGVTLSRPHDPHPSRECYSAVADAPRMPFTNPLALTNVTYRYIELLADLALAEACQRQPALIVGINAMNGNVTCPAVGEAHGLKWQAPVLQ
jgi:alanine dehydrogenase